MTDRKQVAPINARFWTYWNGDFVKLTLKPGDAILLYVSGQTDEGYESEAKSYTHQGNEVTFLIDSSGRDCDGPSASHETLVCALAELHSGCTPPGQKLHRSDCEPPETIIYPNWRLVDSYERDVFAERMGY